jgi:hypothetical protein
MHSQDFMIEVEKSFLRSKNLLIRKEKEYAVNNDRLDQFKRAGEVENVQSTQALIGMMIKHVTPICDMAKNPRDYSDKVWKDRITDLRNYTFLLDALLKDIGVY